MSCKYSEIFELVKIYVNLNLNKFLENIKLRFPKTKYLENYNIKISHVKNDNMEKKLNWAKVRSNPYNFAKSITQTELEMYVQTANTYYYNNQSIIDDNQYDILYNYLEEKYPKSKLLKEIGALVVGKSKIKLPTYLPSMDKIKADTNALEKWKKDFKGPYSCSDKLDGMSLLIVAKNSKYKAYTRGNGIIGQDISWITKYLNCGNLVDGMVRGELVVSKKNWMELKKLYPKYSNARNFVSGYTGKKSIDSNMLKYIDFIAYEFITNVPIKFDYQFNKLNSLKLDTVYNIIQTDVTNSSLSKLLEKRRVESEYEIDGIIVASNNKAYKRSTLSIKNPKYAKAFKMVLDDQTAEVHVTGITWNPSMHGILKPIVNISKVHLDGVNIKNVTGNNAKFLLHNSIGGKIGPGSIVKLTRSGGVIPKILKVIKPYEGDEQNILPSNYDFNWNSTKVDIQLLNPDQNKQVKLKRIEHFMNTLKIPYLKAGLIKKIFENGFTRIIDIINIKKDELLIMEGIKEKSANKIINAITNGIKNANIIDIMAGSHIFGSGFGNKKIKPIIKNIPNVMDFDIKDQNSKKELYQKLLLIDGFQQKTANKFINGLDKFKTFIEPFGKINNNTKDISKDVINGKFSGSIFSYSGFRPCPKLTNYIIDNGGKFDKSVNKSVTHLIFKNTKKITNKMLKAKSLGIKIINLQEIFTEIN